MKETANLKLKKLDLTDGADITIINPNWDVIEENMLKVKSELDNAVLKFKGVLSNIDITTIKGIGVYQVVECTNIPFGYGSVTIKNTNGYIEYEALDIVTGNKYASKTDDKGVWSGWEELATTKKVDISSSLLNGWVVNASFPKLEIYKTGNMITLTGILQDGVKSAGQNICTIPTGFRPSQGFKTNQVAYSSGTLDDQEFPRIAVGSSGTITIETPFTKKYLALSLSWSTEQ